MPAPIRILCLAALAAVLGYAEARADNPSAPAEFAPTLDDWGEYGLIQTPTARPGADGDFNFSFSHVHPYDRFNFMVTPLPWLDGLFRYTEIVNRPYGPLTFSGPQSYKDKSFDVKIRLIEEGDVTPEVALGIHDIAGTGLFSSEYFVASRRYFDFDFSAGLAWGYMSSRATFGNPFGFISKSFNTRPGTNSNSALNIGYFRGPRTALFGGVEYHTPYEGLTLKLEWDPNDYRNEPLGNSFTVRAPVNAAVVYRPLPFIEVSAGLERGDAVMLRVALHTNFNSAGIAHHDTPPPPLVPRAMAAEPVGRPLEQTGLPQIAAPAAAPSAAASPPAPPPASPPPADAGPRAPALAPLDAAAAPAVARRIFDDLAKTNMVGYAFAMERAHAWLRFSQDRYRNAAIAFGRAARVVAADAPPQIETITLDLVDRGLLVQSVSLQRGDLERAAAADGAPEEIWNHVSVAGSDAAAPAGVANDTAFPWFGYGLNPRTRQQIGGPNNFLIYQLYAELTGELHVTPGLSFTGVLGGSLLSNLNSLQQQSNSVLPHVRSDIDRYYREGRSGIFRWEADDLFDIAPDWYGRVSAGLLEEMFAGVDGEVLYRPYDRRWAIGLDMNHVAQRDFGELLRLRDYQVTTGQLSFYYQLPYQHLLAVLRVGRYLAGDKGATLELSREFDSGIRVGVFATKTNVSSSQFGEGGFDKGFFLTVPLDVFFPTPTRSQASYVIHNLTRDGGQMLDIAHPLYDTIRDYDTGRLSAGWPDVMR